MSFIRTKKINGYEYAYIVENSWKRKKVKQKTKKYLGKVYRFSKAENAKGFYECFCLDDKEKYIESIEIDRLFGDLIAYELLKHGFKKEKKNLFSKDNCFVDVKAKRVFNEKGNDISLGFNEGFMSGLMLKKIARFKAVVEEDAYDYAKMFVEAGIDAPKELFVAMFSKFFK